jgi:hypothetical protein
MCQSNNTQEEFIQLNENLRNYHRHRFLQLTLWFAITAGLISDLFSNSYEISFTVKTMLKLIGIITSVMFFVMDLRMVDHWRHFWERLKDIEPSLGFRMWTDRPKRKLLSSTYATWILYSVLTTFWIIALFWPSVF